MSTKLPQALQKVIASTTLSTPVPTINEGIGRIELQSIQFKQAVANGFTLNGIDPEQSLIELTKLCLETLALYQQPKE